MEKTMTVENQENAVRRAPQIFVVPACGFVVAAPTKHFQVGQDTREQMPCLAPRRPSASLTRKINPEQSLRELRRQAASLKSGWVELLLFLFFGLVAIVAMMGCISELFQLLGSAVLEQTVRALLTK